MSGAIRYWLERLVTRNEGLWLSGPLSSLLVHWSSLLTVSTPDTVRWQGGSEPKSLRPTELRRLTSVAPCDRTGRLCYTRVAFLLHVIVGRYASEQDKRPPPSSDATRCCALLPSSVRSKRDRIGSSSRANTIDFVWAIQIARNSIAHILIWGVYSPSCSVNAQRSLVRIQGPTHSLSRTVP
jgi:hypothetical protein